MNRSRTRGRSPTMYIGEYTPEPAGDMYQDDAKTQKISTDDAGTAPLESGD